MGAGKTFVSAAVASLLRLPTLVVCPAIAQTSWQRAAEHFGDRFSVVSYEMLRTGRAGFGKWANPNPKPVEWAQCLFCQQRVDLAKPHPCYCHPAGIHCIDLKKRSANYGAFSFHPGVKNIIFDEVHRCGALDSLNADILIAAKRQKLFITGLSATAACNPLGMRALGYTLDLHNLDVDRLAAGQVIPSFSTWARSHGCRKDAAFHGWKWLVGESKQREVMMSIRSQIIPDRGIRVAWTDIPGFPKRTITAELYDLDAPEKIDGCYKEMEESLVALAARADLDKDPDMKARIILRGRQQVELLKVPIFTELGRDYLTKGMSVVFFVNFRQTIDELFKRFPGARVIDGTERGRQEALDLFQSNEINVLIVNGEAGGICCSMHDLDGLHPRVGLVSPGFSAVTLRQVFGRLHRDGGLSHCFYRVIFANKTVEVQVHRVVAPKLDNFDTLNDADLQPQNLRWT